MTTEDNATELYRRHRPKLLKHLVGQDAAVKVLKELLDGKGLPHFVLLSGPSGCGKTTIARILKTKLQCGEADFQEVNAADTRGIDFAREVRQRMGLSPLGGKCRMWLVDESHRLTSDCQSAFLKMLEDVPSHVYFLFATTDPQKLLPTVRNRATKIHLAPIPDHELAKLVGDTAKKEGVPLTKEVIDKIVEAAEGSGRRSLVILQQVLGLKTEKEQLAAVERDDLKRQAFDLVKALVWERRKKWAEVAAIIRDIDTSDPERLRHFVLAVANTELLKGNANAARANLVIDLFKTPWYDCKEAGLAHCCYEVFSTD